MAPETALALVRPRGTLSWLSHLVRPALIPFLWTVGSRWGHGAFAPCVSPIGRCVLRGSWRSEQREAASPKSGLVQPPPHPVPHRLPPRLPCGNREGSVCLSPPIRSRCRMGGAESGFSLMEELYLEGLLLLFFLGALFVQGTTSHLRHHPSGQKCRARSQAEGASV